MSRFDSSEPPRFPEQHNAFDAEMMPTGPAPLSGMAVAGFVSSVTICCPVFSPLLGLIFSTIGLMQTREGMRRGRGLAIAGLIISLLLVPLHGWVVIAGGTLAIELSRIPVAMSGLVTGETDVALADLYQLGSPELKSSVSESEFVAWVRAEFSARGGLQELSQDVQQPAGRSPDGQHLRLPWAAQFPEGQIVISTDLGFDMWGHVSLENLIIGEADLLATFSGAVDLPAVEGSAGDTEPGGEE